MVGRRNSTRTSWSRLHALLPALLVPVVVFTAVAARTLVVDLTRPTPIPPARWGAAMVYDPAQHGVLLFGGHGLAGELTDTWRWDGRQWNQVHAAVHPPSMANPKLVYDPASHRVLAFDAGGPLGDSTTAAPTVWSWDGSTWTDQWWTEWTVGLPSPDRPLLMTADPDSGTVVALRQTKEAGTFGPALSVWDGKRWIQRLALDLSNVSDVPVAMAWNSGAREVVMLMSREQACGKLMRHGPALFGESASPASSPPEVTPDVCKPYVAPAEGANSVCGDGRASAQLVVLAATARDNWRPITNAGLPCSWTDERLVSDPARNSLLVVGSTAQWTLTGNRWARTPQVPALQARSDAALADDPEHQQVVLFGGRGGGAPSNDTWTWDGQAWRPQSGSPPRPSTPLPGN